MDRARCKVLLQRQDLARLLEMLIFFTEEVYVCTMSIVYVEYILFFLQFIRESEKLSPEFFISS
jgi:hypothetical protein